MKSIKKQLFTFSEIGSDHEVYFDTNPNIYDNIIDEIYNNNNNIALLKFDYRDEENISTMLDYFSYNMDMNDINNRKVIISAYVNTKLFQSFIDCDMEFDVKRYFSKHEINTNPYDFINPINSIRKSAYINTPSFWDILKVVKLINPKLVIIEENITNTQLQQSINDIIGSRTHYPIKLFIDSSKFLTNYTTHNELVQNVHDYRTQSIPKGVINEFIKSNMECDYVDYFEEEY